MAEKLIRDRVPELAAARGDKLDVRVATYEEMPRLLEAKLGEEVAEFLAARTKEDKISELVDVMTVVGTIAETLGLDSVGLSKMAIFQGRERGWFDRRLVLQISESSSKEKIAAMLEQDDRERWERVGRDWDRQDEERRKSERGDK